MPKNSRDLPDNAVRTPVRPIRMRARRAGVDHVQQFKWADVCRSCGEAIAAGDVAYWNDAQGHAHIACSGRS